MDGFAHQNGPAPRLTHGWIGLGGTDRLDRREAVSEDVVRRLFQSPVDSQIFQRGKFAYEGGQVPVGRQKSIRISRT